MLNLREFRGQAHRLADWLPWACLVAPGVILNKDGSFQRTIRYRGPDLDSATEAELMSVTSRVNNVLKRFGSGWALFFDATRVQASEYPRSQFPDECLGSSMRSGEQRSRGPKALLGKIRRGHVDSTSRACCT